MDSFQVRAKDTSVLESSHIVAELRAGAREMNMFPVLIDGHVAYFHDVDGGFSPSGGKLDMPEAGGYHIVNLIHRVQGDDSPPNKAFDDTIEIHMGEMFYQLEVADIIPMGDYPDEDFVLSLKVTDYKMGPYSFSEALSADIDKRHEEFSHNNAE